MGRSTRSRRATKRSAEGPDCCPRGDPLFSADPLQGGGAEISCSHFAVHRFVEPGVRAPRSLSVSHRVSVPVIRIAVRTSANLSVELIPGSNASAIAGALSSNGQGERAA